MKENTKVKWVKITILAKSIKLETKGLTLFETLGLLRLYEQKTSIEILSSEKKL